MSAIVWLKDYFSWKYPPPAPIYSDELKIILTYHQRINRCNPEVDSACGPARTMFLLRTFTGSREVFDIDTSEKRVSRLAFFASYSGRREFYPNLDIRPAK